MHVSEAWACDRILKEYNYSYCYENENGVLKMTKQKLQKQKYRICLHDQRINKNTATT